MVFCVCWFDRLVSVLFIGVLGVVGILLMIVVLIEFGLMVDCVVVVVVVVVVC